ncbi:hypothetical protein F7725_007740 [Dissostichus mawsoni]|uniref:Uncharacterized protein n=1 Tax=Dissostichus mawsoni TaxID=36200 RepID=A0A7J5Y7F9_DISMA|nr:hypothetical protein F7725_007740 [Dissostichus mawsoni]
MALIDSSPYVLQVGQSSEVVGSQLSQPVTVEVYERERLDGADGVTGQGEINKTRHVGKVQGGDLEDEVAAQPELHSSPVNVWRDKESLWRGTESLETLRGSGRHSILDMHGPSLLRFPEAGD